MLNSDHTKPKKSCMTRLAIPIFDHAHPKFLVNFNLCEFVSTCKKIRLFHWFVLEISSIKKSCNLIGWEHFSPYLKLCWNTTNIINFHYRTNSVQITKFFNKLKSFWPIVGTFPNFWERKKISRKICFCYTQLHIDF